MNDTFCCLRIKYTDEENAVSIPPNNDGDVLLDFMTNQKCDLNTANFVTTLYDFGSYETYYTNNNGSFFQYDSNQNRLNVYIDAGNH